VYTPVLAELGDAHFGRKRIQPARATVREFYDEAEPRLQFPVLRFEAEQRGEIADAFLKVIRENCYTCYACAIMPDHVHLVIRKHKDSAEEMIKKLQDDSRSRIVESKFVPPDHPIWTKNGRKVFLNTPNEVRQRIGYVERNPLKDGLPRQVWPFVTAYDNWPFHKKLNRKR
jgi:REP element-mobilizing transposase RayT